MCYRWVTTAGSPRWRGWSWWGRSSCWTLSRTTRSRRRAAGRPGRTRGSRTAAPRSRCSPGHLKHGALRIRDTWLQPTSLEIVDEEVILLLRLQRHQIHAVLTAEVPSLQPISFHFLKTFLEFREEVIVSISLEMFWS